jgi:large subunit ribosomal protein L25
MQVSNENVELTLEKRETVRKGLNKMRRDGLVPAVIHIPGQDSIIVSGTYHDIYKVYKKVGRRHPVDVKVGKDTYLTIIKDVDFENRKHLIRHIVFDVIKQDEKVEIEVPIVFEGDCPAVIAGLVMEKQLDQLSVEAFPKDLPDKILVNVEDLKEINDRITVGDIKAPAGVDILDELEHPIVTIEEKAVIEEEPVVEEVVEDAEAKPGASAETCETATEQSAE